MSELTVVVHVVLYGILAGASVVAITSVLVVLGTGQERINGTAFAIGFLAGQSVVCLLALLVGSETTPTHGDARMVFVSILEILVGLGLLGAARHVAYPHAPRPVPRPLATKVATRRKEVLDRLGSLRPGALLGAGALLGIGGPKRFALALLMAATLGAARLSGTTDASLVAVYVLLATILVWVPVVLTIVLGDRATEWTGAARAWWTTHRTKATVVPLVALGIYFIVLGILDLASS